MDFPVNQKAVMRRVEVGWTTGLVGRRISRSNRDHERPHLYMIFRQICLLCLAWLLAACIGRDSKGGPRQFRLRLESVLSSSAPLDVRLSFSTIARRCGEDEVRGCPVSVPSQNQLAAIAGNAAASLRSQVSIDALHASAVIDLLSADTVGKVIDRSIKYLEMIVRLDPRSADALADLSAAYLVRARMRGDARDLLLSLERSSQAISIESAHPAAQYNRALALSRLGLDGEAIKAWRTYVERDPKSGWGITAVEHLADNSSRGTPGVPSVGAPAESLATFAVAQAYAARVYAWEILLGEWGAALTVNDTPRTAARIAAARTIAGAQAAQFGDSSLANSLAFIADRRGAELQRLGRAHVLNAQGIRQTLLSDYSGAERSFAEVLTNDVLSEGLRRSATLGRANALIYLGRSGEALRLAEQITRELNADEHPSLAGRAYWMLAILHLRASRDNDGLAALAAAQTRYKRAGEWDNVAVTTLLAAERLLKLGDDAGFNELHESLLALRDYPTGVWRHGALVILANNALRLGLNRVALAVQDEDQAIASPTTISAAESMVTRARILWEQGDTVASMAAIAAAAADIEMLPNDIRRRLQSELSLTRATGPLRDSTSIALAALDSVVAFFTVTSNSVKLVPAYVARAGIAIAAGQIKLAESDLTAATRLFESHRRSITSLPNRFALVATARTVFERLAMLHLKNGDHLAALETIERGRVTFSDDRFSPMNKNWRRTDGGVTLDYMLIGDSLITWRIDSTGVEALRATVDHDSVTTLIERVRIALELNAREEYVRADLSRLYEVLIRSHEAWLNRNAPTEIIADQILGEVPFAALYDTRRKEYLVERMTLRWSHAISASRPITPRRSRPAALFVAAANVGGRFEGLPLLPGAEGEVRAAASFYRASTLLIGEHADSASILNALRDATLLHYAGHTLVDARQPEHSTLVVSPLGLSALTIASLDLRQLELAILSACETMRAGATSGGGFASLGTSFLAAGAQGVIGSLWQVDDNRTAAVMWAFHNSYKHSRDAAKSLRDAQLLMLNSSTAELRSPATWGAFRYAQ
jgi:CHAT domain-containing protein